MPLPENNLLYGFAPKLTDEQRRYVDSIFDNQLTIVNAKAGTGKTTIAVACAAVIGKPLTYIFSPVAERTMGFRPGSQSEKEAEYIEPLKSHVFARGTNIKGHTVIIDEAQNFTRGELKKVLTRLHGDCTVIVIGHDGQNDLPNASTSGFLPYLDHFKDEPYVGVHELTVNFRGKLAQHADNLTW